MTASFGLTIVLTVAFDVIGLPALPLLSLAFLAANADLIWQAGARDWGERLRRPRALDARSASSVAPYRCGYERS